MTGLKDKKVLITGASSGIGAAIALRFAQEGAQVAINYRGPAEEEDACRVLNEIGGHGVVVKADIAQEAEVQSMIAGAIAQLGRLDILINNAGIQRPSPSHLISMADFDSVLNVNVRGTFMCCREAIAHFLGRPGGGVIVNNTSVHEVIPKPDYLPYAISKSGLHGLTATLALEYADRGIRVNSVGPGATVTPINRAWTDDPAARQLVESHIPMGRAATAAEIAAVFAFLASDEASYITGQSLFACGGLTLYPEFRHNWSS